MAMSMQHTRIFGTQVEFKGKFLAISAHIRKTKLNK